ncbi:hypothetical protein LINPERHAP2_LOCUS41821, partial [Linum perenne]
MNSQTANHSYASHDIGAGTEARLNDIHGNSRRTPKDNHTFTLTIHPTQVIH